MKSKMEDGKPANIKANLEKKMRVNRMKRPYTKMPSTTVYNTYNRLKKEYDILSSRCFKMAYNMAINAPIKAMQSSRQMP